MVPKTTTILADTVVVLASIAVVPAAAMVVLTAAKVVPETTTVVLMAAIMIFDGRDGASSCHSGCVARRAVNENDCEGV